MFPTHLSHFTFFSFIYLSHFTFFSFIYLSHFTPMYSFLISTQLLHTPLAFYNCPPLYLYHHFCFLYAFHFTFVHLIHLSHHLALPLYIPFSFHSDLFCHKMNYSAISDSCHNIPLYFPGDVVSNRILYSISFIQFPGEIEISSSGFEEKICLLTHS